MNPTSSGGNLSAAPLPDPHLLGACVLIPPTMLQGSTVSSQPLRCALCLQLLRIRSYLQVVLSRPNMSATVGVGGRSGHVPLGVARPEFSPK